MTRTIVLISLIALGILASGFYPITLPVAMLNAVNSSIGALMAFNGLIPMLTIMQAFAFLMLIEVSIISYKLFKWIIG